MFALARFIVSALPSAMPSWNVRLFRRAEIELLVEPGGAAALAALLAGKLDTRGKTAALVLSGGNADFAGIAGLVAKTF